MGDSSNAPSDLVDAEQAMYAPFFGSLGVTSAMIFAGIDTICDNR
jgi:hypothetical protein